jgi:hypothetical protein
VPILDKNFLEKNRHVCVFLLVPRGCNRKTLHVGSEHVPCEFLGEVTVRLSREERHVSKFLLVPQEGNRKTLHVSSECDSLLVPRGGDRKVCT